MNFSNDKCDFNLRENVTIFDDSKEEVYDEPVSAQLLVWEKKDCSKEVDTTVSELCDHQKK